jgi:hypothetical protein|tara:strand:+ start:4706 stop:4951 length:246 start_codon:yes stop_codon:yes gene_type:complete
MGRKVPYRKLSSSAKQYDSRPHLHFTATELPEIKTWVVGEEYELCVKVKQTSTRILEMGKDKGKVIADFTVIGVKDATGKM